MHCIGDGDFLMKPCIALKNVSYQYPFSQQPAIVHVDLSLYEHQFYGITGLNGSGKSTLASILRGFIPTFVKGQFEGNVYYDGIPANEKDIHELSLEIGYVFQDSFNQISAVTETVIEEIAFALENFGLPPKEIDARVDEALTRTHLRDLAFHHPYDLSGGQQQKLAIASALALHPRILIFDEPTSQIDPLGRKEIYQIIHALKEEGRTIVCIDHDADLMAQFSDEIIVLQDGQIIAQGSPKQIYSQDIDNLSYPTMTQLAQALHLEKNAYPVTFEQAVHMFRKEHL